MPRRLVACELQTHERALRMRLGPAAPRDRRSPPPSLEGDGEPDARLERDDLVGELVARTRNAPIRTTSSASSPNGEVSCGAPASQTASQTGGRRPGGTRPRSRALPCSRSATRRSVRRCGRPGARWRTGTNVRSRNAGWVSGVQTSSASRSRLAGPCTATVCIWSVVCLTHTSSPAAGPAPAARRRCTGRRPRTGSCGPRAGTPCSRRSSRRSRCTARCSRPARRRAGGRRG